jgi:uncharacterized protein (DUF305 family)
MSGEFLASRRARLVAAALAAVLALAAAFSIGYVLPTLRLPDDASAEAGFARDMSAHHGQAVEMAMIAYPKVTRPELKAISYDIATLQSSQIGTMQAWLTEWGLSPTTNRPAMAWMADGAAALGPDNRMPGMASADEVQQLRDATGRDADILFTQLMLRHHLGGVHMLDEVLDATDRPEVRRLAEGMKVGQQGEVGTLQKLLNELGAKPR